MVNDKDYLKLFSKDGEDALTEKELSEIIEEELSKPEEEMNTELIESCLDAINSLKKDKKKGADTDGSVKKLRLRRWAAAAAAVVAVVVLSVCFSLKKPESNVPQNELYSVAEENGYGSLNLPAALLTDECEIVSVKAQEATQNGGYADSMIETKSIVVSFVYKGNDCKLAVEKQRSLVKGEEIDLPELAGINAKVYRTDSGYIAVYSDNGCYYTVQMPVSLSEAEEFLKIG